MQRLVHHPRNVAVPRCTRKRGMCRVITTPTRGRRIPQIQRILVVSLDNLGDLVFTSAITPPLRAAFPDAEITLWCKRYTAAIAPLIPGVSAIEAAEPFWDRSPGGARGPLWPFVESVLRLRERHFDVAILAAAPWRTAAAVAAAGARRRIGLARRKNARWLTDVLPPEDISKPVLQEMGRLLVPLGIAPTRLRYALDVAPMEDRRVRLRARVGARLAALHPFASKRARCVDLDAWITAARAIADRGFHPVWVGSRRELEEVRVLGSGVGHFVDELGDGTLADSAALLSLCDLFVGHDSGPLHIAGAFGVPVVGVFTPGEPQRTCPQGIGPSRMLVRPSPVGVTGEDLVQLADDVLQDAVARPPG